MGVFNSPGEINEFDRKQQITFDILVYTCRYMTCDVRILCVLWYTAGASCCLCFVYIAYVMKIYIPRWTLF